MPKNKTLHPALVALFCAASVLLLPVTLLIAVISAIGGDDSLLRCLRRGKAPQPR